MSRVLSARPRHGTVVAYLALLVALGGSGYAATRVDRTHVAARAAKKHRARPRHTDEALDVALIKRKASSLRGPKGDKGDRGPRGSRGPRGFSGANGASGASNVVARSATGAAGATGSAATTSCNAGERATGGGVIPASTLAGAAVVTASGPVTNASATPNAGVANGWTGAVKNDATTGTVSATVYVLCASP